jgi:hypothetical protein
MNTLFVVPDVTVKVTALPNFSVFLATVRALLLLGTAVTVTPIWEAIPDSEV